MDILSYGAASKANKEEDRTRNETLGEEIKGSFSTMKERIDSIDQSIGNVTKQADKLIVQNAVNIMKANAKLNAIAKTKKYNMYNMVFDDLLGLSGIDTEKSSNYTHDSILGMITAGEDCVLETKEEITEDIPKKAILTVEKDEVEEIEIGSYDLIASASAIQSFANTHSNKPFKYFLSYMDINNKLIAMIYVSNNPIHFTLVDNDLMRQSASRTWWIRNNGTVDSSSDTSAKVSSHIQRVEVIFYSTMKIVGNEIILNDNNPNDYKYYISRNNGLTWEPIQPNKVFYFSDTISLSDNKIRLKAELPSGAKLLNYSLTWS